MKHRKLQIAWSVAWGIVAALLIALWMRSYWRRDVIGGTALSRVFAIESADGNMAFNSYYLNPAYTSSPFGLDSYSPKSAGFGTRISGDFLLRYPAIILLFAFLSFVPWVYQISLVGNLHWRFSVRTLFIATTLVAVGLGLIVWAAK